MTAEELIRLKKMMEEDTMSMVPAPEPAPTLPMKIPDPNAGIGMPREPVDYGYVKRAEGLETDASSLEAQAKAPMTKPKGLKEHLVSGARAFLEGLARPQDPYFEQRRREDLHLEGQKDLVARARSARQEAVQQRQLGAQARTQEFNEELQNRPKPFEAGAGTSYGTFDPVTGKHTVAGTVPKSSTENLSDDDQAFSAYMTRPDLNKKFGADRAGFVQWKSSLIEGRQAAGYENRQGDIKFNQERALAQQFLGETNMDRQRLQSYQNIKALGKDLAGGADQIAVLYNFIRLMDPNRVSEGELALAQAGSQSHIERLQVEFERLYGANVFSPEGTARLLATADKMAAGIQQRMQQTGQQYQQDAIRYGLDPNAVTRGAPQLYQQQDPAKPPTTPNSEVKPDNKPAQGQGPRRVRIP